MNLYFRKNNFRGVIHYLKDASHQAKTNIPYGMALTKIFLESGVHIPSEEPKEVLKHTDYYTIGTLSRMGFKKEDGRWTRKIVSAPIPSEVPPSPTEHRRSPAPSIMPPMSPLPQFPSPPPSSYQPYPDPQPPMSYFDNTQALIASFAWILIVSLLLCSYY